MMVKAKVDVDASKVKVKTKGKKIKKNYSSDAFTEAERYEIYRRLFDS